MSVKYLGKKYGGWVSFFDFKLTYYFYAVQEDLGKGKVLAKVWANG